MLDKGRLHGVEVVGSADAFDGDDLVSRVRHGKSKAGVDTATVDVNGAGSTLAVVAALFSTGQVEILTKAVKKSGTRIDLKVMIFPVDVKCYGRGTLDGSSFFLDRGRRRGGGKKRGCRGGGNAGSSQMREEGSSADATEERLTGLGHMTRLFVRCSFGLGLRWMFCHMILFSR
jgi:hypothetical protein